MARAVPKRGADRLARFDFRGRLPSLAASEEAEPKAWVGAPLPRTTREAGAFVEQRFR